MSTSILTLNRSARSWRHTYPASVSSTGVYDVVLEGTTMGSFVPNIGSAASSSGAGASTLAAAAEGDGSYDCSFNPKAGAKFKGFEWLSNVLEVRCTVTATGFAIGGTVKLPPQLTAGVNVGADLDLAVDKNTGLVQTATARLLDSPIPLGPLVTEQINVPTTAP